MAKELPYFRVTCQEWQNGDITLESMAAQGVFFNICVYYWSQNCHLLLDKVQKKFKKYSKIVKKLIELEIILVSEGYIKINFLDKQWAELLDFREKKRIAGSKGGKQKASNATAEVEHNSSYKEKEKDKEKEKENIKHIVEFLNNASKQNYRPNSIKTISLIKARINDGYNIHHFEAVITKKCLEWMKTDMEKYLRPETLFGTKFEGYLNQKAVISEGERLKKIYQLQ